MKIIYEIIMSILAIVSVIFALIDLNSILPLWLTYVDTVIWFIFVIDYFTRLFTSENKKNFAKSNVFDLIAIIPFSSFLRVFRSLKILRLLKITKLAKLTRMLALLTRAYKKISKFFNTNGFKYVLFISIAFIGLGGLSISYLENKSISDGVWWAFVTTTTVGYGDISPATSLGRFVAVILMVLGIGLIGSLTSAITHFFTDKKDEQPKSERIYMVIKLYQELNLEEQEIFKEAIK